MSNFKFLFKYLNKEIVSIILCIILSIITVLCITFIPYFIGDSVDIISSFLEVNSVNTIDWNPLYQNILIICILISLLVIFQLLFDTLLGYFVERITVSVRVDTFNKINKVSIKYIDEQSKGDLISRIINDVDNLNTGLVSGIRQFFSGVVQIIATISIMFYLNWILALTVIVLTPFSFLLSYIIAKKSAKYYKKCNEYIGEGSGIFLEYINNIETIKSFNYGPKSFEKYEKTNLNLYKVGQKAQFVSSLVNPSSRLINNCIYAFVGTLGALLCVLTYENGGNFLNTTMSIGMVTTFLQYSIQYAKPFDGITSCLSEIQNAFSSLTRIKNVFLAPDDIDEGKEVIEGKISDISFENLNFGYVQNQKIIKNFNLDVPYGKKIAIVGPTGCGKTTLINLLLRFYDPNSGEIKLNGVSNLKYSKKSIRSHFGMVLQDTWIFNGTVFENIAYGKKDATLEEVKDACVRANCLDFIERLGKGFDTKIADDSGLSAGQKQLICIARVMLLMPDIMILDEATSNIDTRTEMKITEAFKKLTDGKTSFIIAHRLSTIVSSDLILVLKDGEIIEMGNHKELIEKKGFYYDLYNAQFSN